MLWSFCHLFVSFSVRTVCDPESMHKTTNIPPGHLIRICRADRRWSQQALADRIGCARNTIARMENGGQPSPRMVQRLARVLDLDVELLLPPETTTTPPEGEAEVHTYTQHTHNNDPEVEGEDER